MEVRLYAEQRTAAKKAAQKRDIRFCALLSAVTAAVCICLCLLGKKCDGAWLQWTTAAIATVSGWVVLYRLCNRVMPTAERIKFENELLCAPTNAYCGTVVQVEPPVTMRRHIRCLPLKLQQEGGYVVLYWNAEVPMPDLLSKEVRCCTVRHQIVAYEVTP